MDAVVYPAEPVYQEQMAADDDPHLNPPVLEEMKGEARRSWLWNLFLPGADRAGLTNHCSRGRSVRRSR